MIKYNVMRTVLHPNHKKAPSEHPLDKLALFVGVAQPLTTIPQIWLIYSLQDASGVSFFMWMMYNISSTILILYGIRHKIKIIVWSQSMWIIVQTPMMLSVFIF